MKSYLEGLSSFENLEEKMETVLTVKSPERMEIEKKLNEQPWFNASTEQVQQQLLGLPEYANGFLVDIATSPTIGGGVRILQLIALLTSPLPRKFGIMPVFLVQNIAKPSVVYAYEYHSWVQGPESGSKGVILLENKTGKITHIVCLRGFKFAVRHEVYDVPGGFAKPDEKGIKEMIKRFDKEIREELGLPDIKIKRFIPLGRLQVDAGLTNNYPNLFAAIIDGSRINLKEEEETKNPDPYEMRTSVVVIPIDKIDDFVEENDDAYFLSCIVRLKAKGII